ncbi:hypothetical protein GGX14DRAFT_696507 [Mycena pura]|uniref:Regulatory protein ral2 n=1 Tax=Mycena pura TaxID=153505 RepID=A0AAD6VKF2_9AGAR|nr:hypothetical protein GGX14DRAFT_696507 [Mycena pura]
MPAELHSIYDLTTFCRNTTGNVPAKLVVRSHSSYPLSFHILPECIHNGGGFQDLFRGRLVSERRMVSDLYVFDLETYHWEMIPPFPEDDVPRARYFHSIDTWNNQLIVFGGMSNRPDTSNPDELCVLNDVCFFDIATRHWLPPSGLAIPEHLAPRARYAQLSSVTGDRLFIIGGQDFYNTWLDDVCVYDLLAKTWSEKRDYQRHCGSYRSIAVSSDQCVRFPEEEIRASKVPSLLDLAGTRFKAPALPSTDATPSESLTNLPYSAPPDDEHPSDIYLYSNYNFNDVKRELEVFSPLPGTGFTIDDRSADMSDTTLPPGLRFPTGAILGTHLIIAGIHLAHSNQSYSIWVLDLQTMVWSRIDAGKALESGSWFHGCLWPEANKFMVFGNRNGNLVDDYNRRLLSWDDVAVVDLEAFGVYQSPPLKLDIPVQELGLAALEEQVLADFEIICDDGRKIGCSRKLLEERWPWFQEQRLRLLQSAMKVTETLPSSPMPVPLPGLPGNVPNELRPDPRHTPRAFNLSEPYAITMALLQYFYSMALSTPLQTAPAVLSQLLVLATKYRITHLQSLVRHAMHRALSNSTSVGVYEVATLCSCRSLQIRALKTVMSYTQKRAPRSRTDKDGSGDGGCGPPNNHSGGLSEPKYSTRPQGKSDARLATNNAHNGTRPYNKFNNHRTGNNRYSQIIEDANQLRLLTLPVFSESTLHSRENVASVCTESEIKELITGTTRISLPVSTSLDTMFETVMNPYVHLYAQDESDCDESSSYLSSSHASASSESLASLISRMTASSRMPPMSPQPAGPRALASIEEQQYEDEEDFYGRPAAIVYDVGQALAVQKSRFASTGVNNNAARTRTAAAKEVPNRTSPTPSDVETIATVSASSVHAPPGGHFFKFSRGVSRKAEVRSPMSPVSKLEGATSIMGVLFGQK